MGTGNLIIGIGFTLLLRGGLEKFIEAFLCGINLRRMTGFLGLFTLMTLILVNTIRELVEYNRIHCLNQ